MSFTVYMAVLYAVLTAAAVLAAAAKRKIAALALGTLILTSILALFFLWTVSPM